MEYIKRKEKLKRTDDTKVKLNVGGVIFETWASTLESIKGTRLALLAHLKEADESWDKEKQEFFFDRHPGAFTTILHYYRSDELHIDQNICGNIIRGELEYWGLTELDIEPCCWGTYSKYKDHKETLAALDDNFTSSFEPELYDENASSFTKFKMHAWQFLEEPSSSRGAKTFAVMSMFFVVMSIAIFCLETYHKFRVPIDGAQPINKTKYELIMAPNEDYCIKETVTDAAYKFSDTKPHVVMTILDYVCAAYFTTEFVIRVFFAPRKMQFFRQPLNIIDLLCLIPHLIAIILVTINPNDSTSQLFKSMLALRTIRILRIFKLMKHYSAFNILVYTIKVSTKELLLMVVFLFTGVLIFASVVFYVESETFENIPIGFWWALVTMTTVGYGDKVPKTEGGYIIGCAAVLCGVLTVAFTVPIVVNNFTLYYAHAQSRIKLPPHERKELKRKLFIKSKKSLRLFDKFRRNKDKKQSFSSLDSITSTRAPPYGQESQSPKSEMPNGVYHETDTDVITVSSTSSTRNNSASTDAQNRLHTISETLSSSGSPSVTPIDVEISELEHQHRVETAMLLNNMAENTERLKNEKRRQLELINERRELKRQSREGGKTPRSVPPAAASKGKR